MSTKKPKQNLVKLIQWRLELRNIFGDISSEKPRQKARECIQRWAKVQHTCGCEKKRGARYWIGPSSCDLHKASLNFKAMSPILSTSPRAFFVNSTNGVHREKNINLKYKFKNNPQNYISDVFRINSLIQEEKREQSFPIRMSADFNLIVTHKDRGHVLADYQSASFSH